MDRSLLATAILLLLIEVSVLLGDLGMIPGLEVFRTMETSTQPLIGEIHRANHQVRRRHQGSVLWEDSRRQTPLYSYDTVLTLKNSSAELALEGSSQVRLHENTLVVLEPIDGNKSQRFRLRLNRGGLRSNNPDAPFEMGAGEWVISASPGSDLGVRSLGKDRLEVEVSSGDVELENTTHKIKQTISAGNRLELSAQMVEKQVTLSEQLQWTLGQHQRIYSHEFPATIRLRWKGQASTLRQLGPKGSHQEISLRDKQQSIKLELQPGTYHLNLAQGDEASSSLRLDVWPAPTIYYNTPLPRDRLEVHKPHRFSWIPVKDDFSYRLEISEDPQFQVMTKEFAVNDSSQTLKLTRPGERYWRVYAVDSEGFEIPPQFTYPLFSVQAPLEAPTLMAPQPTRRPSQDKESEPQQNEPADKGAWLDRLIDCLWPQAVAEEPQRLGQILFEWYPVPEADFYTIEISSRADFRDPEVINKVRSTRFAWSGFAPRVYYFRVAAGQDDGRKGLFSKVQSFDLRNIKEGDPELIPGVTYTPPPAPKAKPKTALPSETPKARFGKEHLAPSEKKNRSKVVKQTTLKNSAQAVIEPMAPEDYQILQPQPSQSKGTAQPKATKKVAPKPTVDSKPLPLIATDKRWFVSVAFRPFYSYSQFTKGDLKAQRRGWTPASGTLHINAPLQESGSLQVLLSAAQVDWKSAEASSLQDDLREDRWHVDLLYKPPGRHWSLGIEVERYSVIKRLSDEELGLQSMTAYGLSGRFSSEMFFDSKLESQIALTYGSDILTLHSRSRLLFPFWDSAAIGAFLQIRAAQGSSSQQIIDSHIGWEVKFSW